MLLTNIQHFCLDDGPGIRTTIFFAGCNMKCSWCHNPETVYATAIKICAKEVSVENVYEDVISDKSLYMRSGGGVTFSGGEPVLQLEELCRLAILLKNEKIHIALETAGNYSRDVLEKLLPLVDLFLFDIKCISNDRHLRYMGKNNKQILENIKFLAKNQVGVFPRIPLVWGYNVDKEEILRLAEFINSIGIEEVEFEPYHRYGEGKYKKYNLPYNIKETGVVTDSQLNYCVNTFMRYGIHAVVSE